MTSRSTTPTGKVTSTDNIKQQQQATCYASPLAQHRSLVDVAGRCSPQPPRYSFRPHSPPTSSPSVVPKTHGAAAKDGQGHRYDYQSPSSRDREREVRREHSPLPRIVSNDLSTPSTTVGSLESALGNYTLYSRRALSPRPALGNRSLSGEASAPTSFDSEHLRSISRGSNANNSHQRSNSQEGLGQQNFKRWGPYTSPVQVHRMQQKPYVPTNLKANEETTTSRERKSPPLQLPKQQGDVNSTEGSHFSDADKMSVDKNGEVAEDNNQCAGSKRKDREEDNGGEQSANEQSEISTSHSHFSSLAPPSSHLYGSMGAARRERIGSANSADAKQEQQRRPSPEQDELENDDEPRQPATRIVDGTAVYALTAQRKSCDRCFKMKTKCSRAAPGATGEEPCDGCVRRGFGDDCITSRPDYPYPRISLPKRARRESSLPALLDLNNKDSAVFVPPSMMQRSGDWRTKLIVDSMHRAGSEGYSRGSQQHKQIVHHSMAGKRSVTPQPLPLRSQAGHYTSHSSAWQSSTPGNQGKEAPPSQASRSHVSHLRSLPTSELQDLSLSIAHEVMQRSQPPPLPMTTPIVPSVSIPNHPGKPHHPSQQQINMSRAMQQSGGSLAQQAMQNAPMQLLPKATGLPALHYFEQFIFPLYSLSSLSAAVLSQMYDSYIKPGRNNILELAMAIGLQLQGILLACPDKSQTNTAEGRIFKAFLQTSKQQPEQYSKSMQQGDKNVPSHSDSRVSIDSVKGWIEPARHRSRAKDIVKHVMMRRCLKSGFDYDDVVETSLLGYYYLLRGDVSGFHVCIGNAQRQVALLDIQQNPRDAALWSAQDMRVLQAKATAMDYLHPIRFFLQPTTLMAVTKDGDVVNNDFVLVQEKLSEIALFAQSAVLSKKESIDLDVEVDQLLVSFRQLLPDHLQLSIRSDWITTRSERVDDSWISDMIRGESMTPSLRLNVFLNIGFVRLIARQSHLIRALDAVKNDASKEEQGAATMLDSSLVESIHQVNRISSSMMSSTLLAFTVFPHLICLSQFFAAEMTASAWNFIVGQLVILDSTSKEQRQEMQQGLKKVEDKLASLVEYLTASQEKESWPFAASLEVVKSIIQAARESESRAKEWLTKISVFSANHSKSFTRLLKGDACALDEFRKQMTVTVATNTVPTP